MLTVLFPLQVISGHQLPYSSEKQLKTDRRLYVQIKVTGVESDEQKNKTKIVKNNGNVLLILVILLERLRQIKCILSSKPWRSLKPYITSCPCQECIICICCNFSHQNSDRGTEADESVPCTFYIYGALCKKAFRQILKRLFISWITGNNVRRLQIFAIFAW